MDLEDFFRELLEGIPISIHDRSMSIFSANSFPIPPPRTLTNNLVIKLAKHNYGSFQSDLLYFQANKVTYRCLGLLILAIVFNPEIKTVELQLSHSASEIKQLILSCDDKDLNELAPGYYTSPRAFIYAPEKVGKHPWLYDYLYHHPDLRDLPCFYLTNSQNCLVTEEDWLSRDTVIGAGSDEGSVLFAELLLNISLADNTQTLYELEGEAGFRGVAPTSAEVSLILPGHEFWDTDLLPGD